MRVLLVGLLILVTATTALAQVSGQVESIGFQRYYRPNCWTPMVVSLRPETGEDATYQIQIVQEDFDGDHVTYTIPVTVTGNREGQGTRDIKKEVYFIPKARREPGFPFGLPTPSDGTRPLNRQLLVYVANRNGEQITRLPIPDTIISIDPPVSQHNSVRGAKLILAVSDPSTGSRPIFGTEPLFRPDGGIEHSPVRGNLEDAVIVHVRPRELPESILGYDAVDAVVFANADPSELEQPTPERMRALREFVRQGGKLVICQPAGWERTLNFGDLLPVTFPPIGTGAGAVRGVLDRQENTPLYDLVMEGVPWRTPVRSVFGDRTVRHDIQRRWAAAQTLRLAEEWRKARGPFKVAVAQARPQARVTHWVKWQTEQGTPIETPYIVRQRYGLGAVTWVAQDLGDPSVTRVKIGWPAVWDQVFDWNNRSFVPDPDLKDEQQPLLETYDVRTHGVDLGYPLPQEMEHGQRGAGLVLLVVFFFIAYWVVAGPVSYLVLAGRKRTSLSWFAFAVVAGVATLVTAGVVELVLRADPEIRHFSIVRLNPEGPAVIDSGIGLYIADDGGQRIELTGAAVDHVSYITPYPMHPAHAAYAESQPELPTILNYTIPIPVPKARPDENPQVVIPFRSTLKKLHARWIGDYRGSINGQIALREGQLHGTLINNLPADLRDVYLCYVDASGQDILLYLPQWQKGQTIDLQQVQWHALGAGGGLLALPRQNKAIRDRLDRDGVADFWTEYFYGRLRNSVARFDDSSHHYTLPVLSFFDRFSPMQRTPERTSRVDLLRRGARGMDLSPVVAAGDLAIAGIADQTPLPIPLLVQGDTVEGTGVTFYQAVLPIDRTAPTTQPSTQPFDIE